MSELDFKQLFLTQEGYEEWVRKRERKLSEFSYSFMNNSKWRKVFIAICENKEIFKKCEIHDFFGRCFNEIIFRKIDEDYIDYISSSYLNNYFTTSEYKTPYIEIEFIEFLKYWNDEPIGLLIKPKQETQDTHAIKALLEIIGQFQWEENEKHLRIIGYR